MVTGDAGQLLRLAVLDGAADGDVDDELARHLGGGNGGRVGLDDAQLGHAVLDMLQVAAYAVLALPEALPPPQEILARARRLDAQLAQLLGRQREERLPVRDLRRVLLQVTPDDREESRHVGNEGRRRRHLW